MEAETEGGKASAGNDEYQTTENLQVVSSFDQMHLKEDLLRGIYAYGFEKPSAIQQRAVLPVLEGRDTIAQAQSGTGKTSLLALCINQLVDVSKRSVQALVLSPTRELAAQTEKMTLALGDFLNIQVGSFHLNAAPTPSLPHKTAARANDLLGRWYYLRTLQWALRFT